MAPELFPKPEDVKNYPENDDGQFEPQLTQEADVFAYGLTALEVSIVWFLVAFSGAD